MHFAKKSLEEKVAHKTIAHTGEMHLVALGETSFLPLFHRLESTHDFELVPDGTVGQSGQAVENVASKRTVCVDSITLTTGFTIAVVIGHEDKSALGVDLSDRIAKSQIVVFKEDCVKRLLVGVVNADAENDQIGAKETQITGELALEIVGNSGTVDTDGVIAETGLTVSKTAASEGEGLPLDTGEDNVERVDRPTEVEDITMAGSIDIRGRHIAAFIT